MYTLRPSRPEDGVALVDLWRRSVDATHHFLSAEDRKAIDAEVCGFLPHAPVTVAVDENDTPRGFMLIDGTHMEALFGRSKMDAQGRPYPLIHLRFQGIRQ